MRSKVAWVLIIAFAGVIALALAVSPTGMPAAAQQDPTLMYLDGQRRQREGEIEITRQWQRSIAATEAARLAQTRVAQTAQAVSAQQTAWAIDIAQTRAAGQATAAWQGTAAAMDALATRQALASTGTAQAQVAQATSQAQQMAAAATRAAYQQQQAQENARVVWANLFAGLRAVAIVLLIAFAGALLVIVVRRLWRSRSSLRAQPVEDAPLSDEEILGQLAQRQASIVDVTLDQAQELEKVLGEGRGMDGG